MGKMKTYIYIDGFNLYYGALKGTPHKWLDLMVLFQKLLQSHHHIPRIKYFTARVSGTKTDPQKPTDKTFISELYKSISLK